MQKRQRGPALSQTIRDYVKDFIVNNNLKAGDPLPTEGQLAKELGVSRSPVREAVKALESLGIVDNRHGEGLFVREWNFDPILETFHYGMRIGSEKLLELYQIRVWLELAIIGDAIKQMTRSDITQLEILMLQWEQAAEDDQPYVHFDEEFHSIINKTLANETLEKLFKVFWVAFESYGEENLGYPDPMRVVNEHKVVFQAIKDRDADRARQLMMVQFEGLQERIEILIARKHGEAAIHEVI